MKHLIATIAFTICGVIFIINFSAYAQSNDTNKKADASGYFKKYYQSHDRPSENVQIPETDKGESYWVQDRLCIALLGFAVLLCGSEILLFLKGKLDQQMIIKLIILTLVIFSILFLITAGYDNAQTQTSVGLLGTIAGYLLGRTIPDSAQTGSGTPANNLPSNSNSLN